MKKFLKLFLLLTPLLTTPSIPLNSQISKRGIITVPSLQDMLKTIDINIIPTNNLADIIHGLSYRRQGSSDAENFIRSFLLEQYNNDNLIISEINDNYAIAHLNHSHRINNFNIGFIPDTMEFRINFRPVIQHTNLGQIRSNHLLLIWERLLELNPTITDDIISFLSIKFVTRNSAILIITNISGIVREVEITFETNFYTLSTLNFNTNLGQLSNDDPETILQAFADANESITLEQFQDLNVIFENNQVFISRNYFSIELENNWNIQRLIRVWGIRIELYQGVIIYDRIPVTFSLQGRMAALVTNFIRCFSSSHNLFDLKKRNIETSNFQCFSISKKINDKETLVVENNGIYLKNLILGIILKFDSFNEPISSIELDNSGGVNVVTKTNEVYHLNLKNLSATKVADVTSTNLKKQITLFYKEDKADVVIKNPLNRWNYKIVKDFNLGTINPLKYKKIAFINNNNFETKITLNEDTYYGNKISSYNNQDLNKYISNCHVVEMADGISECGSLKTIELQNFDQNISWIHVLANQKFGLTYYVEDKNFHLQVIVEQEVNLNDACFEGKISSNIGSAIKLFND